MLTQCETLVMSSAGAVNITVTIDWLRIATRTTASTIKIIINNKSMTELIRWKSLTRCGIMKWSTIVWKKGIFVCNKKSIFTKSDMESDDHHYSIWRLYWYRLNFLLAITVGPKRIPTRVDTEKGKCCMKIFSIISWLNGQKQRTKRKFNALHVVVNNFGVRHRTSDCAESNKTQPSFGCWFVCNFLY